MEYRAGGDAAEDFFVVGIGASAGGLEALESFFKNIPAQSGAAYIIVQHLSADFDSLLDEIIRRHARIPIRTASDGARIEVNQAYVMPPASEMIIAEGRIRLTDKSPDEVFSLPIDHFFRSLGQDVGSRSVAIVLSGTGRDGARGIYDVHEAGGLVLAQDPETAAFETMPYYAAETGFVDQILPPELMPEALMKHFTSRLTGTQSATELTELTDESMNALFRLLRSRYGMDFTHYKPSMIVRRIERRLTMGEEFDLGAYAGRLAEDDEELDALYRDLLIGVTSFFRDPDAWASLESELVPRLIDRLSPAEEFRVWVAATATGEEAYSLAMLLFDQFERRGLPPNFRIFATDVHESSLSFASAAVYPVEQVEVFSPDRQRRFFVKKPDGMHIIPELRKTIVFAQHNVIRDAPFTNLDLVSCRNLFIYLKPKVQRKILTLFHFGLKVHGGLWLGASETPGELEEEFEPVNEKARLYQKRRDVRLSSVLRQPLAAPASLTRTVSRAPSNSSSSSQINEVYDRLLCEYMSPGLLLTEDSELIHVFGRGDTVLDRPEGRFTGKIEDLIRKDLRVIVTTGIQKALRERAPVTFRHVNCGSLPPNADLQITVRPVSARPGRRFVLLQFQTRDRSAEVSAPMHELQVDQLSTGEIEALQEELKHTRESLHATIQELQTANEEMQSTNEELVAANEELQSTNEELHSVNEELYTVNAEYQRKITELTDLNNDMDNLLSSTNVHTIFLDRELRIRRFTPGVAQTFNLIPDDVGRRIDSFTHNIDDDDVVAEVTSVLESGDPLQREVEDTNGNSFLLRIQPYMAKGNVEGAVMTLVDITDRVAAEAKVREAIERRDQFLAMLSHELRNPLAAVVTAASVSERRYGETPESQVISQQTRQMARLLDDLLDVSRITRGRIEIRRRPIDVTRLVHQLEEVVQPMAEEKNLDFRVHVPDEPLFINGDPARLEQIQMNLIRNAIKYTPSTGQIDLFIERDGDAVVLRVRDNGVGMPSESVQDMFELFAQADETLDRSEGGMGVGLALVEGLVELHGGTVTGYSEGLGRGAEFCVRLPMIPPPLNGPVRDAQAADENEYVSQRIVIVDDNDACRTMLKSWLELEGHTVEVAEDGAAGVRTICETIPDIAIVDIGLPELDGYGVARAVREQVGHEIRLVAMSGYGQPADRRESKKAGYDCHLVKPVDVDALRHVLKQRLNESFDTLSYRS